LEFPGRRWTAVNLRSKSSRSFGDSIALVMQDTRQQQIFCRHVWIYHAQFWTTVGAVGPQARAFRDSPFFVLCEYIESKPIRPPLQILFHFFAGMSGFTLRKFRQGLKLSVRWEGLRDSPSSVLFVCIESKPIRPPLQIPFLGFLLGSRNTSWSFLAQPLPTPHLDSRSGQRHDGELQYYLPRS